MTPLDGPAAVLLYLSMLLARRSNREYQARLGVSTPMIRLLFHLHRLGPSTLKQLIESTSMDKAQVSRTMAGMVKKGYIDFSGPLENPTRFTARTKAVLSSKGRELLERALVVGRPLHLEVFQALTPRERQVFYDVLHRLVDMAEGWEAAPPAPAAARVPSSKRRQAKAPRRRVKAERPSAA